MRAVDPEWIESIKSPTLGFKHKTSKKVITHLYGLGTDLDCMDVDKLATLMNIPWEVTENHAIKFANDDKYEEQMVDADITT